MSEFNMLYISARLEKALSLFDKNLTTYMP